MNDACVSISPDSVSTEVICVRSATASSTRSSAKRFTSTFIIEVVALVGSGAGVVEVVGAMGLIVVQANGNSVYKFYNPGILHGDGKWRKI